MFHGLDNASYYRLADNVREFWHGDGGKVKDLIERLVGSAPTLITTDARRHRR